MMIRFKKVRTTLNVLLVFYLFIGTLLMLTGCGGNANIPVASVLSSGKITLSWNEVVGAAAYDIYMSTSAGVTTLNSYKISGVTTPITITDLEPGTTYYFMITVYDDSGDSRKSKEISYAIADTEGYIEFGNLVGQPEPDDKFLQPAETTVSAAAEDQPVVKKTSQTVSKKSTKAATKKPAPTATKKTAPAATIPKATPLATKKSSQTIVSSAADTRDVTLAWDNVAGATSYNLYWSDKPGVNRRTGTKIGNIKNPHQLKDLIKGKKYYFVVTAVSQSGESIESAEFSFTVGE